MSTDRLAISCLLLSALVLALSACAGGNRRVEYQPATFRFDWRPHGSIEPQSRRDFRERFDRKVVALQTKLQDEVVIAALHGANERDRQRTRADLLKADERWVRENGGAFAESLVQERCSVSLRHLQQSLPGFAEIFVTNNRGVNVCQTNKTSDYYQADEGWWTQTWDEREAWHGGLEHDASADVIGVALYLPVVDPDTGELLGVAKAVVEDALRARVSSGGPGT
ncbi:MAG: hypothetical protein MJE66_08020 [Proteobacteria bacterium]|nr:hypothetical protein [Pseudomonadota bacterium]